MELEPCCTVIPGAKDELSDEPNRPYWAIINGRMIHGIVEFQPGEGLGGTLEVNSRPDVSEGDSVSVDGQLGDLADELKFTEIVARGVLQMHSQHRI